MPENPSQIYQRGNSLRALGRFEEAVRAYDEALSSQPNFAAALICRGIALRNLMRFDEALTSFDTALAVTPRDYGIWLNRGLVLADMKRFEAALASYEKALAISPGHPHALNNRGIALLAMKRLEEALASFDDAVAVNANNWEALNNRGITLAAMKRFEEALSSYEKALAINPGHADTLCNQGAALLELERFEEALASYEKSLAISPGHTQALNNRGLALSQVGRSEEALASFEAALAINPNDIDALSNRARQLLLLNRLEEAQAGYEKVLERNPGDLNADGGLAELALSLCDWPRSAKIAKEIGAHIANGKSGISPFLLLGYSDDAALQLQCARNHVGAVLPDHPRPLWDGTLYRNDKIKIAYLSSIFCEHPTACLAAELFERHDRSRFEVSAISFGPDDGSEMRSRLIKSFDHFLDVRDKNDSQVAHYLREKRVDIAIDLNGHTQNARFEILSHRPAPVQVNYLGYPGTMGAGFVDYIIADPVVAPFDQQPFFTEKIVHLPDCYQANDSKRAIAAAMSSRREAGLPERGFVFCCFNNSWKINARIFTIWMRLLNAVPGSVLWLFEGSKAMAANLRAEAGARGIDPGRLVFAPRVPLEQHLARHRLADLFLDTLPYNAHTTASDALWAGLPLVTCKGASFASRVAASLLHAIGLPELVADSLQDYEALVLRLARDVALLESVRTKLNKNRLTYPLFDTDRFRRNIETAYTRMVEIAESGQAPQSFSVVPEA